MMASRRRWQVLVPLFAAALAAPALAAPQCAAYAQELALMVEAAEAARGRVDYLAPPEDRVAAAHHDRLALVERDNADRLGRLMASCGWPRASVEGVQAARDAWLVARQREHDLAFQRQVVRQLELAVLDGEAPALHLATASDRLAVQEGRPQRYGTQLRQSGACTWDYHPLDDVARVEARRQRLGLPSLESHRHAINAMIISEHCPAPGAPATRTGR
ncbi:DUF6624 domain-containing protein [Massilia jejuensis]|uniref:DUF6624 domain-containing protein n=1 Tax=Massilia jejuensis TaxID=648894 RepID=A0ABW0PE51_9BURK